MFTEVRASEGPVTLRKGDEELVTQETLGPTQSEIAQFSSNQIQREPLGGCRVPLWTRPRSLLPASLPAPPACCFYFEVSIPFA